MFALHAGDGLHLFESCSRVVQDPCQHKFFAASEHQAFSGVKDDLCAQANGGDATPHINHLMPHVPQALIGIPHLGNNAINRFRVS